MGPRFLMDGARALFVFLVMIGVPPFLLEEMMGYDWWLIVEVLCTFLFFSGYGRAAKKKIRHEVRRAAVEGLAQLLTQQYQMPLNVPTYGKMKIRKISPCSRST